jgi:protein-tyrosine kinase
VDPLDHKASPSNDGVRPRAYLDPAALRARGLVAPGLQPGPVEQDFGRIKRPLLDGMAQSNLVLVTSAQAGEGKTYCALNLALSIAMEQDHTALLVDADIHHSTLLACLGMAPAPGLMDLLLDPAARLAELVLPTSVPGLHLLPSGPRHPRSSELLASQAMQGLLADLAAFDRARIVLFDAPPVLSSSDASVLASRLGRVVFVVGSSTSGRAVRAALRSLDACAHVDLLYNNAPSSGVPS